MSGLDEELGALRGRIETADFVALRVGVRRIAEALLRHVARELNHKDAKWRASAELEALRQEVIPLIRERVGDDFALHVRVVQEFGNSSAHLRIDDVYRVANLRPGSEWTSVQSCLSSLEHLISGFMRVCAPPPTVAREPEEPPAISEDADVEQPSDAAPVSTHADLSTLTVSQALAHGGVRQQLLVLTGWTRTKLTRRLNAVRGNTLLKNAVPVAFASTVQPPAPVTRTHESPESPSLGYEGIGDLTIKQVRDLELEDEIAKLTDLTVQTVKRRMAEKRANAVVRRSFHEWYDAAVIARLTARTALDYQLAPLLARHLHKRTNTVVEALSMAYGQTKLGTVFPALLQD